MSIYSEEDETEYIDRYGRRVMTFRDMLEYTNADVLKKMAKHWGDQKASLHKQACIQVITAGLSSPEQVRRVINTCTPFEQVALRLLCQAGGKVSGENVAVCAALLSTSPDNTGYGRNNTLQWLKPLFEMGLVHTTTSNFESEFSYHYDLLIVAEPEVLREVAALESREPRLRPTPFALPVSTSTPSQTQMRRPQAVALTHSTFVRAVNEMGTIKINRTGTRAISAASLNKLEKLMQKAGWRNSLDYKLDGQPFPKPISAYVAAARYCQLLALDAANSTLKPAKTAEDFGNLSYADQTAMLLEGLTQSPAWNETPTEHDPYFDDESRGLKRATLRNLLCFALAGLPDSAQFIAIQDFSVALFQRIGQHFSLGFLQYRPQPPSVRFSSFSGNKHKQDEEEAYQRELAKWQQTLWQQWQKTEAAFIAAALKSWLYAWGLVELGLENGECVSFRLTPMGREVFVQDGTQADAPNTQPAPTAHDAWVVQPNFDVLVYLERVTAPQLSLIERCAERVSADQHAATYRLTRLSVYDWLERGGTAEALLAALETGSAISLPANVKRELQSWAAQRERITLRQFARLIEFASTQERDAAVLGGQPGTPIGERFLRTHGRGKLRVGFAKQIELINYAQPLPPCLSINEDGEVTLDAKAKDLLVTAQLDDWAERRGENKWQLTEASVKAAVKRGNKINALLGLLQTRLKSKLPPILPVVLAAWAGNPPRLVTETVVAVRCESLQMLDALMSSARFKPYLRARLAPDVAAVDVSKLDGFMAQMRWAGLVAEVLKPS